MLHLVFHLKTEGNGSRIKTYIHLLGIILLVDDKLIDCSIKVFLLSLQENFILVTSLLCFADRE